MEQQTFEGTWEEILLHSSELVGRRVKLTVVDSESPKPQTANTLDKRLHDRVGRVHFQPSDLSERTGDRSIITRTIRHQSGEPDHAPMSL